MIMIKSVLRVGTRDGRHITGVFGGHMNGSALSGYGL